MRNRWIINRDAARYGNVLDCRVANDRSGAPRAGILKAEPGDLAAPRLLRWRIRRRSRRLT